MGRAVRPMHVCLDCLMHVCLDCLQHRVCASAVYGRAIDSLSSAQANRVTCQGVCETCHTEFLAFMILLCIMCVGGVRFNKQQMIHVLRRPWPDVDILLASAATPLIITDYDTFTVQPMPPRTLLTPTDPRYDHVFSALVCQQILPERILDGVQDVAQTTPSPSK